MYAVTVVMFLSMALVLGSLLTLFVFLLYPFLIAGRIRNEEKILSQELNGYSEYMKKVKFRVIPFVW